MYLFARSRSIVPGSMPAAVGVAIEAANRVQEITGIRCWAWTPVMSPAITTAVWTARVEHLSELEVAGDKLAASSEFGDFLTQSDHLFTGPLDDSVTQVLYGTPSEQPMPYVQVAQGTCANGAVAEAMGLGVELAETGSRVTGMQTMFGAGLNGAYASVAWITGAADLDAVEAANAALAASDEWVKLIDRAGHAFQPGVTVMMLRRLN